MPYKTGLRLLGVARNPANGFPARLLGRDDIKVNSLAPFAREYHQRAGDYLERATGYARQGIRHPFQVTRVVMTDEDSCTCEYCNREFETIGAWRRHDGRDPKNGEKLTDVAGTTQCQRKR